jgi:hypothetical protein
LTFVGDHLLRAERQACELSGEVPPFVTTVPAFFMHALLKAYTELYMLDDYPLVMSYFNKTSPFAYPDRRKFEKAMLLMPHPDLVLNNLDKTSSLLTAHRGPYLS